MAYWRSCALIGFILLLKFVDRSFPEDPDYDFDIERVETIFGDEETIVIHDWKVHRKGKDHFISGTTNYTQDLDNTFMRTVYAEYSPTGNKYFSKTPLKLAPLPICVFYNTSYRKFIEPNFIGRTDFPIIPPEGLCPIPKGVYYFKDLDFRNVTNVPQHVPSGLWKVNDRFIRENKVVGGLVILVRIHSISTS